MVRISTISGTLLLLITILIGCSKTQEDPNVITDINDDLNVFLWEELVDGERNFVLKVETVRHQDCMNYELAHTINRFADNITLSVDQLIAPDDCETGYSPAHLSVRIGSLEPISYKIELNLQQNEIVNKGQLLVSSSQYSIVLETDHGIILPEPILNRVPNNTIWGYIGFNDATEEFNIRNEFHSLITDLVSAGNFTPGHYGHFSLTTANELSVDAGKEYPKQLDFLYHFDGEEQDLVTLLEDFRTQFGDLMEIKIFTANGSVL